MSIKKRITKIGIGTSIFSLGVGCLFVISFLLSGSRTASGVAIFLSTFLLLSLSLVLGFYYLSQHLDTKYYLIKLYTAIGFGSIIFIISLLGTPFALLKTLSSFQYLQYNRLQTQQFQKYSKGKAPIENGVWEYAPKYYDYSFHYTNPIRLIVPCQNGKIHGKVVDFDNEIDLYYHQGVLDSTIQRSNFEPHNN